MSGVKSPAAVIGAALVLTCTAFLTAADGITKFFAGSYAAPQLYAVSGAVVVLLSMAADRHPRQRRGLRTGCPRLMLLRSAATVLSALGFFHAFRLLGFAEVFLFLALTPLLSALMSGPMAGEPVRPTAWAALVLGFLGVVFLFPGGVSGVSAGHLAAFCGALTGAFSMVVARCIAKRESNALAQVFYPNLALCLTMAAALPFVWLPMPLADLAWAGAYGLCLFAGRWLMVAALQLLPAYAVTPLMNFQFVWMVLLGAVAFGEWPAAGTFFGALAVACSGAFLVWEQKAAGRAGQPQSGSASRILSRPLARAPR